MKKIGYINHSRDFIHLSVAFSTLGCKVNRYETDQVRQIFEGLGFRIVDEKDIADIYIVNTCTVTSEADRKSGQILRRFKKKNPDAIVAAMGCRSEIRSGVNQPQDADIAVGTGNRLQIVADLIQALQDRYKDRLLLPEDWSGCEDYAGIPVISQEETRAYIKIEDGCDAFCTYCIIPFARGRVRSRARDEIRHEAEILASRGFREIVVTGIHLCSYGKDLGRGIDSLAEVLEDLCAIEGIHRIRLGSLEPKSLDEGFIRRIAALPKLCPQFHLSLQSGCDSTLKKMNRKYNTTDFRQAVDLLRQCFPNCAVTTDIIVGFPGESPEEHEQSLSFCSEISFSRIHIFPYSEREGTAAAGMRPKVSEADKEYRKNAFAEREKELRRKYAESFVGKTCEVLVEGEAGPVTSPSGYTSEYVRCHISSPVSLQSGVPVIVKIREAREGELYGVLYTE